MDAPYFSCRYFWSLKTEQFPEVIGLTAISYTVGVVSRKRPFFTKAHIGLSYTVDKERFRLNVFRLRFSTGSASQKTQSKKFFMCFFNPSHRSSHHQAHTHTPIHPYQVPHTSIIQGADAGLSKTAVAFRRTSAWRIPSSARHQRVSHDGINARHRSHFANSRYACCSLGGSRLSATPRT